MYLFTYSVDSYGFCSLPGLELGKARAQRTQFLGLPSGAPNLGEMEAGPDTPVCKIRPGAQDEVKSLPNTLWRRGY